MSTVRRCGDYPELFWGIDPSTPLELTCARSRVGLPEHVRIRWRPVMDTADSGCGGTDSGKAA